jgi:hypothetical protein
VFSFLRRKGKPNASLQSDKYKSLVGQYIDMHELGDAETGVPPQDMFSGFSIMNYREALKSVTTVMMPRTALDYGSGKGRAYTLSQAYTLPDGSKSDLVTFLGLQSVTCYDPAYPPFMEKPSGKFDCVISTDVLEHCPEEDIDWILAELFSYARDFVFLSIAGYPASKTLPNGENAHITIKPLVWWKQKLDAELEKHAGLRYFAIYDEHPTVGQAQTHLRGYCPPKT